MSTIASGVKLDEAALGELEGTRRSGERAYSEERG
jgi:hypothetical protein